MLWVSESSQYQAGRLIRGGMPVPGPGLPTIQPIAASQLTASSGKPWLDGCPYIDKVDGGKRKQQQGAVIIEAETDRIYLDTTATCIIEDAGWRRRIEIAQAGSWSTVVWNPWIAKARRLADSGDEKCQGMVCVETTYAAGDVITVLPGAEHRFRFLDSTPRGDAASGLGQAVTGWP